MSDNAFFTGKKEEVKNEGGKEEVEKIKLGEEEFTQDELQEMVGVSKKVKSFEEKGGKGFDDMVKSWGQRGDRLGKQEQELKELREFRKGVEEKEVQTTQQKAAKGKELTREEQVQLALAEAEGIGLMTTRNVRQEISNVIAGIKLRDECDDFESSGNPYEEEKLPKFKAKDMIDYMAETGINNPQIAYDVRYKDEIATWKEGELSKAKPKGLPTEKSSTLGGKAPKQVKITKENLPEMTRAALRGEI